MRSQFLLIVIFSLVLQPDLFSQQLIVAGKPSRLDLRKAGENSIRITLKPLHYQKDFPSTPAVVERIYPSAVISLEKSNSIKKTIGIFKVEITQKPLNVSIYKQGRLVQRFVFNDDGTLSFNISNEMILGLGEGGSKPAAGVNWRNLPVEYDRRGLYDSMQPRWQSDAYGSRNPVPMLIGTGGWASFVASPWVQVDLR